MALATPAPRVLADLVPSAIVRNVVLVVAGAAFVAASAQIAFYLPWNPVVPLTLQTFAVVLAAGALGTWRGVSAMVLYTAVGSLGVPIFRLGSSGWGGPTFGYVLAFIVAAAVVGRLAENGGTRRFWQSVGLMLLGNVIIYVIGSVWLKYSLGISWFGEESVWVYGVRDFLVGDVIKILAAAGLLPLAWKAVSRFSR